MIADRRVLLVLDNCEHLVLEVAGLVDSLLAECPRLRVLTTSREPLSIPGEHLHQVGPLGLPPAGSTDDDYPSVQLFVDRGRAVRPDFAITDGNREAIAEICRRLDGMPLAIELAAARLRALTPTQIVERLEDRFRLLTSGSRTALPRHQTLRAVVEWSWELLEPNEQAVARRLSFFSGGATLEAAEQICSGPDLPPEAVLGVLASLVDKSLVEAAADDRSVRYRMLETVKAYGAEQLTASGELDRVRATHLVYFADLVRQGGKQLRTGAQLQWIARFDADNENLLSALRNAIDTGDAETSLAVVAVLGEYWNMRGRPAEALSWFEAALALTGPADPLTKATTLMLYAFGTLSFGEDPSLTFRGALRGLAHVRLLSRRHPAVAASGIGLFTNGVWAGIVRRDGAECYRYLELAGEHPDPWTRAMALQMRAMLRENDGDIEQMVADLTNALDQFRELGDRWGTSLALRGLGAYQGAIGDHRAAVESYSDALRLVEELGTTEGVGQLITQRAASRANFGDLDGARQDLHHSLQLAEENGSRSGEMIALCGMAGLARWEGRLDEALELAEKAYSLLHPGVQHLAPHGEALMLGELARVHVAREDLATAREKSRRSVELALTSEDMPLIAAIVEVAAEAALAGGKAEDAARVHGLAASIRGMRTTPDCDVRRVVDGLQETLGSRYDEHYEAGASLPRDEALAELRKRFSSP